MISQNQNSNLTLFNRLCDSGTCRIGVLSAMLNRRETTADNDKTYFLLIHTFYVEPDKIDKFTASNCKFHKML